MSSFQEAKEQVKRAADIVEVVGQYVQLKKVGRNFSGLCPFHAEKAPSFTVNRERQMFHCFGCKQGGDVFAFWMAYHGATFKEALKELAERYNVLLEDVRFESGTRERSMRQSLLEVNEKAAQYFEQTLADEKAGRPGRDYLDQRGLSPGTRAAFRLGYGPDGWDGLARFLQRAKADCEAAVQAGLIAPRKHGGYYDRFRNRVIFPIFNHTQQVIGFGGRVLGEDNPKYLNSPESAVFHKGEVLYGLHAAFQSIRQSGRVVLVEGYMDLLALWEHGFREAVATLGTALTADHVRRLRGYCEEAVVVFDADEAGKKAAMRSLPLFLDEDLGAKAVVLPPDEDPDSFVRARGLEAFQALLEQAEPMFDVFLKQALQKTEDGVEEKVRALRQVLPVLGALRQRPRQALYVKRLSEALTIREDVIWGELREPRAERPVLEARLDSPQVASRYGRDVHFLNLIVHFPETAERLEPSGWESLLTDPDAREIAGAVFDHYREQGALAPEAILERLGRDSAREQLREILLQSPFYDAESVDLAVSEFTERARQLRITKSIQEAREKRDLESLNNLLKLKARSTLGP